MARYFVPYFGDKPAAVNINGHRLLILSRDRDSLEEGLQVIGADSLKSLKTSGSRDEDERVLNRLARRSGAGVVVAPEDVDVSDVIRNLKQQLPWLQ